MHYFFNSSINCVQHNKKQTSVLVPVFKQTNKQTYPSMGKQITFSLSEDSFFTLHVLSVSISCSPSLLENDTNAILVSFSSVVSMTTSVVRVGLRLLALPDTRTRAHSKSIPCIRMTNNDAHFSISVPRRQMQPCFR